jgi:hypothetical protein
MDRVQRREMLIKYFNEAELRTLCFELNVEYEDLGGASRSGKALELVMYCERHGLTSKLEAALLARAAQAQAAASGAPPQHPPTAAPAVEVEKFADLEIRIRKREDAGYPVEMRLSDRPPFPTGYLAADMATWSPGNDRTDAGRQLFARLKEDAQLLTNWARASERSSHRRLRWWIDDTAPELHAIPWELMRDEEVMLAADAKTPFSRFLLVDEPWSPPVQGHPIRVLVAIANPKDGEARGLTPIDAQKECAALQAAFNAVGSRLQPKFVESPVTLEQLQTKMQDEQYHVLHLVAHGKYDSRKRAWLYLQDEQENAREVRDADLENVLAHQNVRPHVVFLAACQGAKRSMTDAFAGLGPRLVRARVPAVVAMQEVVSFESARKFSTRFYERLLKHGLVDLAANEARSTLLTAGRPDAAVPVLFMRLRDGRLWNVE